VVFSDGGSWALSLVGVEPQLGKMTINGDRLSLDDSRINLDAAPAKQGLTVDLSIGRGGSLALTNDAILSATNTVLVGAYVGGTLTAGTLSVGAYSGGWSSGIDVQDGLFSISGTQAGWSAAGTGDGAFLDVSVAGESPQAELLVSAGGTLSQGSAAAGELSIGSGAGAGTVMVTGAGSFLGIDDIYLGNGDVGTLTVADLATVQTTILDIGFEGDGVVEVTGSGTLQAAGAIIVGSQQVPVNSVLEITNFGSVYAGTGGLELQEGTLKLDPTAVLFGPILALGGRIEAEARAGHAGGVVRLGQPVSLGDSFGDPQFGSITNLSAAAGVRLDVAGQVSTSFTDTTLQVGAGNVSLDNATNVIAHVALAGGVLTIAATGADGRGVLSFQNAYSPTAATVSELVVNAGVKVTDVLTGFDAGSTIDLKGFAFGGGVTDSLVNGTLTLKDGSSSTSLVLAGTYSAGEFTFAKDAGTGTVISFHKV
jgi:T5SS/PEP-CTERM-associated repeat protein